MSRSRISRRGFFRTGAVAIGGGAALAAGSGAGMAQEAESRNEREGMRYRVLGRTNLRVSELTMGGLGATAEVLSASLDKGVNLFHTSIQYNGGASFVEGAKVLPDRRDEVFLAVKSLGETVDEFAGWLAMLKVEQAEIVFHPTTVVEDAKDENGALREKYQALKDRGLVRALGLTVHSNVHPVVAAAVDTDVWDCLMPVYGLQVRPGLADSVDRASEKSIGVLSMKTMQGLDPGSEEFVTAFKAALDKPGLSSVLKGLTSFDMLDGLVKAVGERPTADEQAALYRSYVASRASSCGMCSNCSVCPNGLAVEEIVRCALYYESELADCGHARQVYRSLPAERTALACGDCGTCESACPNGLPIRRIMRDAHGRLA